MRNLNDQWEVICERARVNDVRIHDCRHSFAFKALALGESLPMIGRLLGRSEAQTTGRCAHVAGNWVRESAVRISDSIAADTLAGYRTQSSGDAREPSACPPGEAVPITSSVPTRTRADFS